MIRRVLKLRPLILSVVALTLAALVTLQYWPEAPPAPRMAPPVPKQALITLNPMSERQAADFAPLFDHPLFTPSRARPVVDAPAVEAPVEVPDPAPAEAPKGPAQPVLMGTVTSPFPGGAYLGDDAGGPVIFLRPGQAALGLHLEEVHAHSALFMGPEGEVTLELRQIAPDAADASAAGPNAAGPGGGAMPAP